MKKIVIVVSLLVSGVAYAGQHEDCKRKDDGLRKARMQRPSLQDFKKADGTPYFSDVDCVDKNASYEQLLAAKKAMEDNSDECL